MNRIAAIIHFYLEGFRSMTWGRVLWGIILLKLFIMFVILKWFFFPDYLGNLEGEAAVSDYISSELVERAINP